MTYILTNYNQIFISVPNLLLNIISFKNQTGIYSPSDLVYTVIKL